MFRRALYRLRMVAYRLYRGADKSLARRGRKQARQYVRDARDSDKIEMRAVMKFLFLQGEAPKEIHAVLTETLGCFLPGRAKGLSASFTCCQWLSIDILEAQSWVESLVLPVHVCLCSICWVESILITTTKIASRWHVWYAKTCCRIDNV